METKLFNWKSWAIQDTMHFSFYDVVIKIQIGPYPPGKNLAIVDLDYGNGIISVWEGNDVEGCAWTGKLELNVI